MNTIERVGAVAALVATVSGTFVTAAQAAGLRPAADNGTVAAPLLYKNCTSLNKRYRGLDRTESPARRRDSAG